eukprot:1112632-Ditylum_brightwellii.AAC.1
MLKSSQNTSAKSSTTLIRHPVKNQPYQSSPPVRSSSALVTLPALMRCAMLACRCVMAKPLVLLASHQMHFRQWSFA